MARIKLSPLVSSINGKLGNAVFQAGKSGIILREKVVVRNRNTTKQVLARNRLSTVKSAWQNLNTTQRNSWISFASFYQKKTKFNSTKILSPYELFIQHNTVRIQGGFDILLETSFVVATVDLYDIGLILVPSVSLHSFVSIIPEADIDNFVYYISKPFKQSASIGKSEVRFIYDDNNPSVNLNITSLYKGLFSRLPNIGEKVLVKIIAFSETSGWNSKPFFQEIFFN